ncbi:MAG: hypothetical protein GY866_39670 [Proteobacteria bacterium]|nr:hypothetical protein [Pseudomonadota bacterium]
MNRLLTFSRIQQITNGRWLQPPTDLGQELSVGAFDTRSLGDAQIFFSLKGESSDGHRYLHQLENSGIRLILVEKTLPPVGDIAMLEVSETLGALHAVSRALAQEFDGKIVSITGSSGKTTAKTWLSHILEDSFRLLQNAGNFNNHLGCPITVLNIKPTHDLLILEMGSSGLGELELLSSIAPADITLLLNVGHAHLGKFGSLDNTYRAKTEIFSHQRNQAVSLVPYADRYLRKFMDGRDCQYFGKGSPRFSWETQAVDSGKREQEILFDTPYGRKRAVVGQLGDHVGDILSGIIAVCCFLGVSWERIEEKLTTLPQEKGRSTFLTGANGVLILDDTYNANPESAINMLRTICSLEKKNTIAVIGNLAELDADLAESSEVILENLPSQLTRLFLSGETGKILMPLIRKKYPDLEITLLDSIGETIEGMKSLADEETVVGVKGSRSAHMERIVYGLNGRDISCSLNSCPKLIMCRNCDQL